MDYLKVISFNTVPNTNQLTKIRRFLWPWTSWYLKVGIALNNYIRMSTIYHIKVSDVPCIPELRSVNYRGGGRGWVGMLSAVDNDN